MDDGGWECGDAEELGTVKCEAVTGEGVKCEGVNGDDVTGDFMDQEQAADTEKPVV